MFMKVIKCPKKMHKISSELSLSGKKIGFVPTMGALHKGHLSLIKKSVSLCDETIVSIFVNPTQFAKGEDLACYPRNFKEDKTLCRQEDVSLIFHPSSSAMYPNGFQSTVFPGKLATVLEGKARPSHFAGVATVCCKLFNIVNPSIAFFGQKDYQQFLILKQMVFDLNLPLKLFMCPIVREKDGLALSSRNKYLSKSERADALALFSALSAGKKLIFSGERNVSKIKNSMNSVFSDFPLAKPEYIEVADSDNLSPVKKCSGKTILLVSAKLGKTRLIDNMLVKA